MYITMTKEELLKRLASQESKARKEDEAKTKEHRKDEEKAMKKFRDKLREALKWDYATAKKKSHDYRTRLDLESPSCPRLEAPRFTKMIEGVKLDMRKAPYRIHDGGDIDRALQWKPEREKAAQTVCD